MNHVIYQRLQFVYMSMLKFVFAMATHLCKPILADFWKQPYLLYQTMNRVYQLVEL
jgi:hypothetical protein